MGHIFVIDDVLEVDLLEESKLVVIKTGCRGRAITLLFLMSFGKQFAWNDDLLVALFGQVRYHVLIE